MSLTPAPCPPPPPAICFDPCQLFALAGWVFAALHLGMIAGALVGVYVLPH